MLTEKQPSGDLLLFFKAGFDSPGDSFLPSCQSSRRIAYRIFSVSVVREMGGPSGEVSSQSWESDSFQGPVVTEEVCSRYLNVISGGSIASISLVTFLYFSLSFEYLAISSSEAPHCSAVKHASSTISYANI